jgi:peptidoglycan/LPS O-acetylase OafA/YrhL
MRGNSYRLGRRPALDGLRGLAVLLVVASHSQWTDPRSAGVVGVTLFFVLSGFLITRLLLEENDETGRIDLRAFIGRRARRLLPALGLFLATLAAAKVPLGAIAVTAFYSADIPWVVHLVSRDGLPYLGHTWTLSLEEQFYVMWPLTLTLLIRRRRTFPFLVAGIAAVTIWRAILVWQGAPYDRVAFGVDVRVDALLAGCLLGVCVNRLNARSSRPFAIVGGTVLVLGCGVFELAGSAWMLVPVTAGAVAVVAWAGMATTTSVLTWGPLRGLGRISYGVYLWHYPIALATAPRMPFWAAFPITLAFSVSLATLSWRCIEQPTLARAARMKQHPVESVPQEGDELGDPDASVGQGRPTSRSVEAGTAAIVAER